MTVVADPVLDLIDQLSGLRPRLATIEDQGARNEALQICKNLMSSLSQPASTAVELAFAVCCHLSIRTHDFPPSS